ncbi:dsDNA nuclease domain-containing protein [Myxococcus sp. AM010]|uniref:dsDNA nuclease domain-containing protein n=1 Tax=Myxococcus sp. AM010 TaxID=2745138 RepID=UPI0015956EAE|nr:DUF4297 domain-containing protein [Myxococcus sp. AM010]
MPPASKPPSIHALVPLESGGTTARSGFMYQDHIAVSFCVEMLAERRIEAIWCEVHDDLTLIWNDTGVQEVEFVQVKSDRRDSLWSPAVLCHRDKKDKAEVKGSSMLERSLAHAKCQEPHRFRIITAADVHSDLRVLMHERGTPQRHRDHPDARALFDKITGVLQDLPADGPGGLRFWLDSVLWEVRGVEEAVRNTTTVKLSGFLHDFFDMSAPDQVREVYDFLLHAVEQSAAVRVPPPFDAKKLPLHRVLSELKAKIQALKHPYSAAGGNPLRRALTRMGMAEMDIEHVLQEHAEHMATVRRQAFFSGKDAASVFREVEALLHRLRLEYKPGSAEETPMVRYVRCLKALEALHATLPADGRPPSPIFAE